MGSFVIYIACLAAFVAVVILYGKKSEDAGKKEQEAKQAKRVVDEQVQALGIDDNLNNPEYVARVRSRFTRK